VWWGSEKQKSRKGKRCGQDRTGQGQEQEEEEEEEGTGGLTPGRTEAGEGEGMTLTSWILVFLSVDMDEK
jgi:hypothetical protein